MSVTSASSDFNNAGTMNIGATSTFTVGGGHDYIQSGGLTYLQASTSNLVAHTININGGTLQGFGTVTGNLVNGGTVHPGDGPGILTVTGNYTQTSAGILDIQIGGPNAGTGFSQLNITGTAALGGTLDLSLINGFTPYNGETFTILTSAGLNSSVFSAYNGLQEGNVTFTVAYTPGDVILDAIVSSLCARAVVAGHLRNRHGRTWSLCRVPATKCPELSLLSRFLRLGQLGLDLA